MSEPTLYRRIDAQQFAYEDWVVGTELCLGKHHNYVPVEPDYEAAALVYVGGVAVRVERHHIAEVQRIVDAALGIGDNDGE